MINNQTVIEAIKPQTFEVKRGEIWLTKLTSEGSVQGGIRPVIIISNGLANKYSPVLTVVPLTSKLGKRQMPTHVLIDDLEGLTETSVVLCEQILTSPKLNLIKKLSECTDEIMTKIDKAVKIQLEFQTVGSNNSTQSNEIEKINKAKRMVNGIQELDEFIIECKPKKIESLLKSRDIQISELKYYCKEINLNVIKFYDEKYFTHKINMLYIEGQKIMMG